MFSALPLTELNLSFPPSSFSAVFLISSFGSTAITVQPISSSWDDKMPVPEPISATMDSRPNPAEFFRY